MLEYVRVHSYYDKKYSGIITLFRQMEKKEERGGLLQPLSSQLLDDVISAKHRLKLSRHILAITLEAELTLDDRET